MKYEILEKEILNPTVIRMRIHAPLVAKKAEAGQFIILRTDEDGERIPLTVADYDREGGSIDIIFQIVGATTERLARMRQGEGLCDFVGPLGMPTELQGVKRALVIGGGVGCAIALPIAKALKEKGASVTSIIGFRTRDLVILEDAFRAVSENIFVMTDDGSYGEKGNVTMPMKALLEAGELFDRVIAIGPLVMMKYAVETVRPYPIPITVSMNPIMIDGTGMCGGCRLTLVDEDGTRKTRFACVDGPDFDGRLVDFDEAIRRSRMYSEFERHAHTEACNLYRGVEIQ